MQRTTPHANSTTACLFAVLVLLRWEVATADDVPLARQERLVEWTVESRKPYADPFNDVDVDVIFSKAGESWRVPMFWRGGHQWTVRFAPPSPGEYNFRLQSTDPDNDDLNGHAGRVRIDAYRGPNELLRHGAPRVSPNKRSFVHADGTPFYWLGDTWWTGLSDRLSWQGFQRLTADRKAKGFTVVQIVAGLVPLETAPADPGYCNEGGCVWNAGYQQINPKYFDYADRRIQLLVDNGLVPAIVGGWNRSLGELGVAKMQKHWRYIMARYGAYPVFWIVGGEVLDPPKDKEVYVPERLKLLVVRGWTDVARFIRATDPYHHPLTVHELPPPLDLPLQDESLTDFDLVQSGQYGWGSIANSVAQLNMHYARTFVTKPIVQGEIGFESHVNQHFEDFQRIAFWLSMLNGAAGHTYGADATWGAQSGDKSLHRPPLSFRNWEEGMNLPGSYQVGLNAKLLRAYPWWEFEPHPEWVTPRGTTLLDPRTEIRGDELGARPSPEELDGDNDFASLYDYPKGEWQARNGNFRRPYAAGIPGKVRFVYIPAHLRNAPTVLGLEPGTHYRAYWWEPSMGIRFDLGTIGRPVPGVTVFEDRFIESNSVDWTEHGTGRSTRKNGVLSVRGQMLTVLNGLHEANVVAAVGAQSNQSATLIVRFQDPENYVAAVYSPSEQALYLLDRKGGVDGRALGKTVVPMVGNQIRLSIEVRDNKVAASITDGERTYTTPIVSISNSAAGSAGLFHQEPGVQKFEHFELQRCPVLAEEEFSQRKLYDARGEPRGDLTGWEDFGRKKQILLDAYQPPPMPTPGDWLLVLEGGEKNPDSGENSTSRVQPLERE